MLLQGGLVWIINEGGVCWVEQGFSPAFMRLFSMWL